MALILKLAGTRRTGTCNVCGKKVWSRARAVVVRLVAHETRQDEWTAFEICKKCLDRIVSQLPPRGVPGLTPLGKPERS